MLIPFQTKLCRLCNSFVRFFLNCDLHMIKMYTPFSYSFGYVGTVSTFWTPHDILLWDYFQLMLPSKIKLPTQVLRAHKNYPTCEIYCRCNLRGQRHWFKGKEWAVWTKQMITRIFTRQPKELFNKESAES